MHFVSSISSDISGTTELGAWSFALGKQERQNAGELLRTNLSDISPMQCQGITYDKLFELERTQKQNAT